jgi:hypothetical protein
MPEPTLNPEGPFYLHRAESVLLGGTTTHSALCYSLRKQISDAADPDQWKKCWNFGRTTAADQLPWESQNGKKPTTTYLGPVSDRQITALDAAHKEFVDAGPYRVIPKPFFPRRICWDHVDALEKTWRMTPYSLGSK